MTSNQQAEMVGQLPSLSKINIIPEDTNSRENEAEQKEDSLPAPADSLIRKSDNSNLKLTQLGVVDISICVIISLVVSVIVTLVSRIAIVVKEPYCECNSKFNPQGVNGEIINDGSINPDKLANFSITSEKLANDSIHYFHLHSAFMLPASQVSNIPNNNLNTISGVLDGSKIGSGTLPLDRLIPNSNLLVNMIHKISTLSGNFESVHEFTALTVPAMSVAEILDFNCQYISLDLHMIICTSSSTVCESYDFKCFGGNTLITDSCFKVFDYDQGVKLFTMTIISDKLKITNSEATPQDLMITKKYIFRNP